MISTIYKTKSITLYFSEIKWNIYLVSIALSFVLVSFLQAEYPRSTTMLTKTNNKYYLKNTGEVYTGHVINMSKKTWKKILETYLINGHIYGKYREWYPNGVLKYEGSFIDGKREGVFYTWFPNGKKKNEMKYVNNVLDSISVSFLQNGMVERKHNHDTDLAYVWDYSDSPKSLNRFTEQFGKLNGDYTKWDTYGRKIEEGYYYNNKKDSIWYKYDLAGLVYEKGRFKDGQKDGVWLNYDQYGRSSSKSYYNKDNLVKDDLQIKYYSWDLSQIEFNRLVNGDMIMTLCAIVFVFIWILVHVGSVFIASFSMLQIIFSMPAAFLVYRFVFGINYFTQLHGCAIFLALGIGADDIFVFSDAWKQSKHDIELDTKLKS